jgi:osmotically-inducible protein OsmY
MRKQLFTILASAALGLLLIGCDPYNDETRRTTTTTPSPGLSDSDLENRIKERFNADAQLRAANLEVDANVSRNEVTLSGTVDSQALRTRAVEIAKAAHSGVLVTDKIDVKPRELARAEYTEEHAREERQRASERGETIGSTLDDAWIHAKIVAKLIGNTATPQRKINVDVNNNIVTLRGTVENAAAKAEAERVAKETEGVKRVVNQLKVQAS